MVNNPFLNQTKTIPLPGRKPGEFFQCYEITILTGKNSGIWQEVNPVTQALPAFVMQLIIITSLTHLLFLLLRPLRQPRIVAEIIAGVLLGPSFMGKIKKHSPFLDAIFSASTFMTLETMGNIGLIYFLFLIGLEIDVTTVSRVGRKALTIALAGTIFPFAIGLALYYLLLKEFGDGFKMGCVFWGVALSVTGLPVVTQILAKLKLLYTDIGKTAMSSALVNEMLSWVLLTMSVALGSDMTRAPWALLSTAGFVLVCVFAIRPIIIRTIRRTQRGGYYREETICITLTMVLACGLATDVLGTNSMIGAFMFGLVIPNGLLGPRFLEVLRGFVEDLLMPLFFTASGFRTNFDVVWGSSHWILVGVVIGVSCLSKVVSTLVVSMFYGMSLREGVALGLLMNTKGLLAIIVINNGRDQMVIEDKAFTVMLISLLLMTMATQPIMSMLYQPMKPVLPSKHRAIQRLKPDAELRILACVHEAHSLPGFVALLEASDPSKRSSLAVFALHLIQLTGHTTALVIAHGPAQNHSQSNSNGNAAVQASDHIFGALEGLEDGHHGISVQSLTAMSPYATMHVDIFNIAEDKRVALIILPFHKRQTIHNKMEDLNHHYKDVNDNVLDNAPCSVGILIDRGLGKLAQTAGDQNAKRQVAMIYIGGPDDREALSYARKMAGGHPKTTLTVVRFVEAKHEVDLKLLDVIGDSDEVLIETSMDDEAEIRLDEGFIENFRHQTTGDKSIIYWEKEVDNGAEIVDTIRTMGSDFELYVVGRGMGLSSPLIAGLDEWSECPELGAIGDLLLTSDFSSAVSVLVVQQFADRGLSKHPRASIFQPFAKHRDLEQGY